MDANHPAARHGEGFEQYVERQFEAIHDRLTNIQRSVSIVSGAVPGLIADVDQLAQAIPAIAQGLADLHSELEAKETSLNEEIVKEGKDEAEIATLKGELAQVETAKQALDPLVAQANSLVPAGGQPGGQPGEGGQPPAPLPGGTTGAAHEGPGGAHSGPGGV